MRKKNNVFVLFLLLIGGLGYSQNKVDLNIDFFKKGVAVSPMLYGIFFEDINFAADGGLYAEQIRNRSFEEGLAYWSLVNMSSSKGSITLETQNLLNTTQTKCLKITADSIGSEGKVSVLNNGFWGINMIDKAEYKLTFFAKASPGFTGLVTVSLLNNSGNVEYAQVRIGSLSSEWKKYTCTMVANENYNVGKFSIGINAVGSVWIDVVSLFPPTFKNRPNGTRIDLAQKLADLHPKFMRFPGGCFVEGDYMANRFQWKKSIGNIEDRPGHNNFWSYRTSDGMGFHEFLQLSEDLDAVPLYVMNIGIAHKDVIPYNTLTSQIQDELDALEYANGPVTSTYGAMRAANGHPEPFNIKYVEIGNENNQDVQSDHYADRYIQFYNAIKAKYPDIICIGDVEAWGTDYPSWKNGHPVDLLDEHYYRTPEWFLGMANKYDSYSRTGPKIYVGEYAVTNGSGNGNLAAALGEAAYMTGMERNSDVVQLCSYAPIFGNINQRQWNPDLIYYNSSNSYGTPSYLVQRMFANNLGTHNVIVKDSLNVINKFKFNGSIGVGAWATQCQYDSIIVKSGDSIVVSENFDNNAAGWAVNSGTWSVSNGVYQQTGTGTDCRSTIGNINLHKYSIKLKALKKSGSEGFLVVFAGADSKNFYWLNLGGWGNTQAALEQSVNGTRSAIMTTPNTIVNNKWYDIQIDVNEDTVRCFLDNKIIFNYINTYLKYLYSSCTVDSAKGDIYLKVINFNSSEKLGSFTLKNLPENSTLAGTVETMSYSNTSSENSLTLPKLIYPQISKFTANKDGFQFKFVANSVNVFHLFPQSTVLHIDSTTYTLPENKSNGSFVGTIAATGAGTYKYSILNTTVNGAFKINSATGTITVNDSSLLNFETNPTITLTVSANDASNINAVAARSQIIINLSDVNEVPIILNSKYYAFINDSIGAYVGRVFVQDGEKTQNYSFTIKSQTPVTILKINSSNGELTIGNNSSLSTMASKSVTFVVNVTDNGSPMLSYEKEFTLEILDKPLLTAINAKKNNENIFIVYPNPARNNISVRSDVLYKNSFLKIVDSKGVSVEEINVKDNITLINTSNLSNGIYIIQFVADGQVIGIRNFEILK